MLVSVLPRLALGDNLTVSFIGSKETWRKLTGSRGTVLRQKFRHVCQQRSNAFLATSHHFLQIFPDLSIDPTKVHAYLSIKSRIDPSYATVTVLPIDLSAVDLACLVDDIVDSALVSEDPVPLLLEREARSDISKPEFDPTLESDPEDEIDHTTITLQEDLGARASTEPGLFPIPMDNIFITRRAEGSLPDNIDILRAFRDQTTERGESLPVVVGDTPINEFQRNHVLFLGSFSHLFLLGEGMQRTRGSFNKREIHHLLFQHNNRFSQCSAFVFAAFNQMQRHDAILQVSIRVKNNHYAMTAFDEMVNDPSFTERIADAIAHPQSQDSKELCSKVMDIARITGSNVRYSEMERRGELSKMISMMHYAGPFSFFVTIAPSDLESRLIIRLSRRRSNHRLPEHTNLCVEDGDIVFPSATLPPLAHRRLLLSKNPVAATIIYKRLIECMFEHLIGLQASHVTRSNAQCMGDRKEGALGKPTCYSGVSEVSFLRLLCYNRSH
jgi:hypothetical protein